MPGCDSWNSMEEELTGGNELKITHNSQPIQTTTH